MTTSEPPTPAPIPLASEARSLRRMADLQSVALALALAVAILWLLSDVILLLFAATLIACQLKGAASFLSRHLPLSYGVSLTVVVLAIFGGVGTALWLHGPTLIAETTIVYNQINDQIGHLWQELGNVSWLQGALKRVQNYIDHLSSHVAGYAAGFVTTTLGNAGSLLLILVAAIYLAAAPDTYSEGLIGLMPHRWRTRGRAVMHREATTLRWWFIGQLIDMVAIGLLTGVGLLFLGVKLSVTLGLIAALCNFVPYIGALAGSIPAILVGLSEGPTTAAYVAALFVVVQTVEGNLIAPLIQRRTVDLPPIITLLSQTVLGTLFGPFGLILATPITAGAMVMVNMVYRETILGDEIPQPKHGE